MNVIVIGLGRMGTGLARKLDRQGHSVCAVDQDPERLEELGEGYTGRKVTGVGFDRDVLAKAGIDRASAVVSCTTSDEANIIIARIARDAYRVPRVIARMYDVTKAETYRRLGIQTISTTDWGVRRACELLTYNQQESVFQVGTGEVQIVRADVPALLEGHPVRDISAVGEVKVIAVSHNSETFIPTQGTVLGHGDVVYAAVASSAAGKFAHMLGKSE